MMPRPGDLMREKGGGRKNARPTASRLLLVTILVAYCCYAAGFVYRTSFVINGRRFFCLFDDAMISMRYAKNLAHGYGLVWNPAGERVEGFTSPLWTLFMALFHLLPVPERMMSLPVQVSGALCVLLLLLCLRRIALTLSRGGEFAALSAMALTAFYLPLNNWGLQGMEVSAITLLVTASACLLLGRVCRGSSERGGPAERAAATDAAQMPCPDGHGHSRPAAGRDALSAVPYVLLAVATLVRLDAVVLLLAAMLFGMLADRNHRKQHLLWGVVALAVSVGSQTAFRLIYYGDPLPNTYYLKMTGYPVSLRMLRGWLCFVEFVRHAPWWMLALGLVGVVWRRDRGRWLLLTLFLAQCAYSIYVGGDAWEWWGGANRYLTVVMPLFFVLLPVGVGDMVSRVVAELRERRRALAPVVRTAAVALVVTCLMASNRSGPTCAAEWLLRAPAFNCELNVLNVELAEMIRAATTDQALVAVGWAGATPYFSHRPCHDLLGRCDRRIAHEQAHIPATRQAVLRFVPGHVKHDFDYSVLELRPDLVLHDVSHGRRQRDLAVLYAQVNLGMQRIYARRGSERVRWEVIRELAQGQ